MNLAADSDESLMLRYRDGECLAFEQLYARHKGALHRYFRRHGVNHALCEEMFQDVWMSLIRTRANYRVEAKFTTYLYRLAHNRLIDHYRRNARVEFEPDALEQVAAETTYQPEHVVELAQRETRLLEAISRLPLEQREVFLLRAETGMTVEDIARALGVPLETAKSRLRYAVSKLARCLRETSDETHNSLAGTA